MGPIYIPLPGSNADSAKLFLVGGTVSSLRLAEPKVYLLLVEQTPFWHVHWPDRDGTGHSCQSPEKVTRPSSEWPLSFPLDWSMRMAQLAPLAESVPPKLYGRTERVVSWLDG